MADLVRLPIKDGNGVLRNSKAFSSDGTIEGDMNAAVAIVDSAQSVINPAREDGNLAEILSKLSADPASETTLALVVAALTSLLSVAATAANQTTANTSLSSINTKTPALSGGRVPVDGSGVTQPVSAASLPLPSGASTAANQTTGNTSLASIDTKTPALASGRVPVDGSGVTQPTIRPPLTFTTVAGSPFTLTSSWAKVATTTSATKGLTIAPIAGATAYDIEWAVVTANASAPTDTYGVPIQGGEDFAAGLPIGDVYLKSATGQKAIVRTGA